MSVCSTKWACALCVPSIILNLNLHVLIAGQYTEANVKIAQAHQDFVMGFISMTPAKWAWGPGAPGQICPFIVLLV